jgi:DNA-binding transcriptional LysR family regulator
MNLHGVDLNLLGVLHALLDERNVTRAAARVHLSQPAASNALARLRHLFGDPLLVRGDGGLVLTPRAQALVEPLSLAISQIEATLTAGSGFDAPSSTVTFTLATSDALQIGLLPLLMSHLAGQAPGIQLVCTPLVGVAKGTGDPAPERELASGDVDLALGFFAKPPAQLHARRLFDGDFACVVRQEHPVAKRALTARQFVELGHVVTTASHHDQSTVDATLARHAMQRKAAVVVPQYSVVPYVIARSDFIAVLPRALAEGFARLFGLRVIEPPLKLPGYTISQLWHERTHRSLAHRWLRETVTGLVAGLPVAASSRTKVLRR